MTVFKSPGSGSKFVLPRRSLLKGGAALGMSTALGAPFINRLFAAEEHPLAGQSIEMNILGIAGWVPSSLGVKMSPLFADFVKEKYGYNVSFAFAEAPFSDLFQKAATSLATKSQEYNIIISDSQWLGALAKPGWILKLNDVIEKNPALQLEWYSQTVVDTYMTYPDGTKDIWGLPQEGDVEALYVRKDWLEDPKEKEAFQAKYGKPLPQTFEDFDALTMDEFEKIAEFFTRPDDQRWGFAQQYSRVYDFATCAFNNFLWSRGGEIWDPATGQIEGILNTRQNADSLQAFKDWLKYCPPGATNYGIAEGIDVFTQGKVFSTIQWAAVGSAMITDELKGKVLVVPPPKHGTGDAAKRICSMGGQPWVINAFNDEKKMRVAIDFMNWWYQPDTAMQLVSDARQLSVRCGFKSGVVRSMQSMGTLFMAQGLYDSSLACYDQALQYAAKQEPKDTATNITLYSNSAAVYVSWGRYEEALQLQYKAMHMATGTRFSKLLCLIYNNIGSILYELGQTDKAFYYLDKAKDIAFRVKEANFVLPYIYMNEALLFLKEHKTDASKEKCSLAIAANKKFQSTEVAYAVADLMGNIYKAENKPEQAIASYKSILDMKQDYPSGKLQALISLGNMYLDLEQYPRALAYLQEAMQKAKALSGNRELKRIYEGLVSVYRNQQQYALALDYEDKLITIKDSLLDIEKVRSLSILEVKRRNPCRHCAAPGLIRFFLLV